MLPLLLAPLLYYVTTAHAGMLPPSPIKYKFQPPPSSLVCSIETNVPSYFSEFNQTALLRCEGNKNGTASSTRVEKICIIGAGSSGIHLGYLLKRRGFHNTVIFEQRNRTGGDVWTLDKNAAPRSDGITRELGVRKFDFIYIYFFFFPRVCISFLSQGFVVGHSYCG